MRNNDRAAHSAKTRAVLRDARALGRLGTRDERFQQDLRARLLRQAAGQGMPHTIQLAAVTPPPARSRRRVPWLAWRAKGRLVSLLAAVLLALGGLLGYLQWDPAAPVSAQTILRRAAAALPQAAPGRFVHDVSVVHRTQLPSTNMNALVDETVESWTQWDASGAVARDATMEFAGTSVAAPLLERSVQIGHSVTSFNAQGRITSRMTRLWPAPPKGQMLIDPFNAASMRQFILDAARGVDRQVRLLGEQTLDGSPVYAVRITRTLPGKTQAHHAMAMPWFVTTFYVRVGSYALDQLDFTEFNAHGAVLQSFTVRVVTYEVLPASVVPPAAFSLRDSID